MFHMPESRFSAFAIHLLVSVCVFSSVALFTYFILLPGFLFFSEGGFTILRLIGGVDVVLGPLITLLIYKKTKPSIKFDLSIIAILQIAALLYGLSSLWSVRPLAVFYAQGEYYITYESTFSSEADRSKRKSIPELNQLKPPFLAIELPENINSLTTQAFRYKFSTGNSFFTNQDKYKDYETALDSLDKYGIKPAQAIKESIIDKDSPLAKKDSERFAFYPYQSSLESGYVMLDTKTGDFIDIVN